MKQPENYHIDKNVIVLLLAVMLVSIGVLGFKAVNYNPCQVVNFDIAAKQFRVGEIIRFKDYSENTTSVEWNFGDDSEHRFDTNPFHTYEEAGNYDVLLTVNGRCELVKKLVIEEKLDLIDSSRIATFTIPSTIKVGELLLAKDETKEATSWEWRFGETAEVNSTYRNPSYSYKTPGLKTVTLMVNGDPRYSTQKKIRVTKAKKNKGLTRRTAPVANRNAVSVLPYKPTNVSTIPNAPPSNTPTSSKPEEPAEPKVPRISKNAFANKIIDVGLKKATAADFNDYLCGNLQVITIAKGKKTTFIEFCEKIKGKKVKVKSLEIFKNKKSQCIEYISIDYSK